MSRPDPASSLSERARSWLTWFGVGRLVAASVATVVVAVGGFWLVRSSPPATEATLPFATSTTVAVPASSVAVGAAGPSVGDVETPVAVLVHVTGAVARPGVYELLADARVADAVLAAGGPITDADADALNLAAHVGDGTRVYVPMIGEEIDEPLLSGGPPSGGAQVASTGPVDVNRATAIELDALPGVGPATAAAIVTERERNGPFAGVDDLERVPGIGPAKLEALRDLVST